MYFFDKETELFNLQLIFENLTTSQEFTGFYIININWLLQLLRSDHFAGRIYYSLQPLKRDWPNQYNSFAEIRLTDWEDNIVT